MSAPPAPQNVSSELLRTPLYDLHTTLGAKMVPFAGYAMPVQYPEGLMKEHLHTRQAAGLFDVSHMGQISVTGADCIAFLERLMPVDVAGLAVGKQRYGLLLNEDGGIIDDLMFFRRATNDFLLIVNGACKHGDLAHMQAVAAAMQGDVSITAQFDRALLALQGPQAAQALTRLAPDVAKFVFMTGGNVTVQGIDSFITRSGYTGEDGFEIACAAEDAEQLAKSLLAQPEVKPIGLGARNSLRLEAGLCLYGADMDTSATPAEADLLWAIQKVRKAASIDGALNPRVGGFVGSDALLAQINGSAPLRKKRVALVAKDRIPVREPSPIHALQGDAVGEMIGHVTSGLLSPNLDQPIAFAYVTPDAATLGNTVHAIVRGKPVAMEVVKTPFVPTRYYRG